MDKHWLGKLSKCYERFFSYAPELILECSPIQGGSMRRVIPRDVLNIKALVSVELNQIRGA